MKKLKWTLSSAAIIISISGAFANRPPFDCLSYTQYYFAGGVYNIAGTEGVNYICVSGSGTCTYYTEDGIDFYPCQTGSYCTSNCFIRGTTRH
jgi:hypothetical protein